MDHNFDLSAFKGTSNGFGDGVYSGMSRMSDSERKKYFGKLQKVGLASPTNDGFFTELGESVMQGATEWVGGVGKTMTELGLGDGLERAVDDYQSRHMDRLPYAGYAPSKSFISLGALGRTIGSGVGSTLPSIALSAIPGVGPYAGFMATAASIYGDRVRQMRELLPDAGNETVYGAALLTSCVESLIEQGLGPQRMVSAWAKGGSKVVSNSAKASVLAALRESVKKNGENALMRIGKAIVMGGAEEGFEETLQDASLNITAKLFGSEAPMDFSQTLENTIAGFVSGGAMGGAGNAAFGRRRSGITVTNADGTNVEMSPQALADTAYLGGTISEKNARRAGVPVSATALAAHQAIVDDANAGAFTSKGGTDFENLAPEQKAKNLENGRKFVDMVNGLRMSDGKGEQLLVVMDDSVVDNASGKANEQLTTPLDKKMIDGFRNGNVIYLRGDGRDVTRILGHELKHWLDSNHADLAKQFDSDIESYINNAGRKALADTIEKYKGDEKIGKQEFMADMFGSVLSNGKWAKSFAGKLEAKKPGLGARFIQAAKQFLDSFISYVKGKPEYKDQADQLVSKYQKVSDNLGTLLNELVKRGEGAYNEKAGAIVNATNAVLQKRVDEKATKDAKEEERRARKREAFNTRHMEKEQARMHDAMESEAKRNALASNAEKAQSSVDSYTESQANAKAREVRGPKVDGKAENEKRNERISRTNRRLKQFDNMVSKWAIKDPEFRRLHKDTLASLDNAKEEMDLDEINRILDNFFPVVSAYNKQNGKKAQAKRVAQEARDARAESIAKEKADAEARAKEEADFNAELEEEARKKEESDAAYEKAFRELVREEKAKEKAAEIERKANERTEKTKRESERIEENRRRMEDDKRTKRMKSTANRLRLFQEAIDKYGALKNKDLRDAYYNELKMLDDALDNGDLDGINKMLDFLAPRIIRSNRFKEEAEARRANMQRREERIEERASKYRRDLEEADTMRELKAEDDARAKAEAKRNAEYEAEFGKMLAEDEAETKALEEMYREEEKDKPANTNPFASVVPKPFKYNKNGEKARAEVLARTTQESFDDAISQGVKASSSKARDLYNKMTAEEKSAFAREVAQGVSDRYGAEDWVDYNSEEEDAAFAVRISAQELLEQRQKEQADKSVDGVEYDDEEFNEEPQFSVRSLAKSCGFEASIGGKDIVTISYQGKQIKWKNGSFVIGDRKASDSDIADIVRKSPVGALLRQTLKAGYIDGDSYERQLDLFSGLVKLIARNKDELTTQQFAGSLLFTAMKENSDKQYKTTYDFPSICTKTQAVIDQMSAAAVAKGHGLTSEEILSIYRKVALNGLPVPCPECYVFSRWIGVGGLLENISKYQKRFGAMTKEQVQSEYKKYSDLITRVAEENDLSFGKAKGKLGKKFTDLWKKLDEKVSKAENQGEKVSKKDRHDLEVLSAQMDTVKAMSWIEDVYLANNGDKSRYEVPSEILFDLNRTEEFAMYFPEAWGFRCTQGAGYGKAITPYSEAVLGEGIHTEASKAFIKAKQKWVRNHPGKEMPNYFLSLGKDGELTSDAKKKLAAAIAKERAQAFIGGQRIQSTSDARPENMTDYIIAGLELQAMGAFGQGYTKVLGAVPLFSKMGFGVNMSLMPLGGGIDAKGNPVDTSYGGVPLEEAKRYRDAYETAGTITVGVNDRHIRLMFNQDFRDFIIPYHASGGKVAIVNEMRRIQERGGKIDIVRSSDYTNVQSEKVLSDVRLQDLGYSDADIALINARRNARLDILTGKKPDMSVVNGSRFLRHLYDMVCTPEGEWSGVKIEKGIVEGQIYPNEYWDKSLTYERSGKITQDYLDYCKELGFLQKFSGKRLTKDGLVQVYGYDDKGKRVPLENLAYKNGVDGEVEPYFWKVLVDRRMYGNELDENGEHKYLEQGRLTLDDIDINDAKHFADHITGPTYDKDKSMALAKETSEEFAKKYNGIQFSTRQDDSRTKQVNPVIPGSPNYKERQDQLDNATHERHSDADVLEKAKKTIQRSGSIDDFVKDILEGNIEVKGDIVQTAVRLVQNSEKFYKLPDETRLAFYEKDTAVGTDLAQQFRQRRIDIHKPDDLKALLRRIVDEDSLKRRKEGKNKGKTLAEIISEATGVDPLNIPDEVLTDPVKRDEYLRKVSASMKGRMDKAYEYWVNAILSSPTTHAANTIGNLSNVLYELGPKRLAEIMVSSLPFMRTKTNQGARFGEYRAMLKNVNWRKAWADAKHAFNFEMDDFDGKFMENGPAIGGKHGRAIRLPGRFLKAADAIVKSLVQPMEASAMAYREGVSKGLEGNALENYIANQLSDANSNANYFGARRALELTFQEDPGATVRWLMGAKNSSMVTKFLFPFVKTPYNIIRQSIRKGPLGIVPTGIEMAKVFSGKAQMDAQFIEHVAEQIVFWTAAMALMGMHGGDDEPWLTGSMDARYGTGEYEFKNKNIPPNSIRIGDHWFSYSRIEPLASSLSVFADGMNALKKANDGDKTTSALKAMMFGTAKILKDKSYLQTFQELNELLEDPENQGSRMVSNFAASWVPNAYRSFVNSMQDEIPNYRNRESGVEWWKKFFVDTVSRAGLARKTPKLDYFGREVKKDDSESTLNALAWRLLLPVQKKAADMDRMDEMFWEYNRENPDDAYYPSLPNPTGTIDGKKITFTSHYDEFVERSGKLAYKMMQTAVQRGEINTSRPRKEDISRVKAIFTNARRQVREEMYRKGRYDK